MNLWNKNDSGIILEIRGTTSSLTLYKDYLVIRSSNIQRINASDKTIPLSSVLTVTYNKPLLKSPYIQVITADMAVGKNDIVKGAEKNVVLISSQNKGKVLKLQQYISQYKANPVPASQFQSSYTSYTDELERLAELKEKGIITQEEFDEKKKKILGI